MMRRRLLLAVVALAFSAAAVAQTPSPRPVTAIIVRHAEKAATPADDPPLTSEGEARARALLDAVRNAHVDAIITTQLLRTRSTAAPTAKALGIQPEIVPTGGSTHAQDVAKAIRAHAGQTVLVVGHSNTVPAIIEALGGVRPPPICDAEFDELFVVTIAADGTAGVIRSTYGARSVLDATCPAMTTANPRQ